MIQMEEKVKLMREVSMEKAANRLVIQAQMKETVRQLTDLKFQVVTLEQIKKKLTKFYWDFGDRSPIILFSLFSLMGAVVWDQRHPVLACFLSGTIVLGCSLAAFLYQSDLSWQSLMDWREDVPYGALLAVKEAQEAGIEDFKVWYPTKDSRTRMEDPIITGEKDGVLVQIAHWDDQMLRDE